MFYWSHRDTHVVLTDREESTLVRELSDGPEDSIGYSISHATRRKLEQRVFRYFRRLLRDDPEAFNRRFVSRSCYDKEAQALFPVLLDAYGRITRRATFGAYGELPDAEELPDKILYHSTADLYQVTLLGHGRWPWSQPTVTGRFSFPARTIHKLAGTADNFFAATNTLHMKFHRDYVRISILDSTVAIQ
jgi:hypothetical protein